MVAVCCIQNRLNPRKGRAAVGFSSWDRLIIGCNFHAVYQNTVQGRSTPRAAPQYWLWLQRQKIEQNWTKPLDPRKQGVLQAGIFSLEVGIASHSSRFRDLVRMYFRSLTFIPKHGSMLHLNLVIISAGSSTKALTRSAILAIVAPSTTR